jgi:hypothetical protein
MSELKAENIEAFLSQSIFSPLPDNNVETIFDKSFSTHNFLDYAIDEILYSLKFKKPILSEKQFSTKLRLALHFAPKNAINFDYKSSLSRFKLIENFISKNFPTLDSEKICILARSVSVVLDSWDKSRKQGVRQKLDKILSDQNGKCNHCHISFHDQSRIKQEESKINTPDQDHYKPYYDGQGVSESMSPHVDHVEAVSRFGNNRTNNLQVLCSLCNLGKGDGSFVNPVQEFKFAANDIENVPIGHRRKMFYNRIRIDDYKCTLCGSSEFELSIRLAREDGGYILSNLRSRCYDCI